MIKLIMIIIGVLNIASIVITGFDASQLTIVLLALTGYFQELVIEKLQEKLDRKNESTTKY